MNNKPASMSDAYRDLLHSVNFGIIEYNERTNTKVYMIPGGWSFKLDLSALCLPIPGNRKYYPKVAAAETAWQFMATKDPSFILSRAPKLWEKFVDNGELETAYGFRWCKHFGRNQLQLAIDELKNHPTNRQLYISAWDPSRDGLGGKQPKNIPCPVGFSLNRIGYDLHASVFIRSSDVFVGLPYDVMNYALTIDAIAMEVGCRPASLHFTLANAHCYDTHIKYVEESIIDRAIDWTIFCEPKLPRVSISDILKEPENYIKKVIELSKLVNSNKWDPKPEIIE